MFEDSEQALSRRQLFTDALPRGLAGLLRGALQARHDLQAWAAAESAPLSAWAMPQSSATQEARRAVDELQDRRRRSDPERDAAVLAARAELPKDPAERNQYLDQLAERLRAAVMGGADRAPAGLEAATRSGEGSAKP
jgi:hypothetical protein